MKVVSTANAPAAIGPYSQALDLGNMVFVSGQIPVDPATGTMADTVEQQAAQSLANLKAILAEAVPRPQLRAGGSHPQGRKAGDRVHRRAGLSEK